MADRKQLSKILHGFCDNVYFQPPESVKMVYPAIRYSVDKFNNQYADDTTYIAKKNYQIIVIDTDPDSTIAEQVNTIPSVSSSNVYVADSLYHYVFNIYF